MPATETSKSSKAIKREAKKFAEKVQAIEEDPESTDLERADDDYELSSSDELEGFDIFQDVAKSLLSKGDMPKFFIHKDNAMITIRQHPYSWDRLQKEYGPGLYKIICKSGLTGRYIKSQSQVIGNPNPEAHKSEIPFTFGGQSFEEEKPAPSGQPDFMSIMTFMKTLNSDAESKAREAAERERDKAREQASTQNSTMALIMQMMQQQATQNQQMFIEMNKNSSEASKNNMLMWKEINDSNNRMFEKINERISAKKEDGISVAQQIKMLQDAEDRGFRLFEKVNTIADEKAEEKAALLNNDEKDESLTKQLIKGFIPLITQAANNQTAQAQVGQPGLQPPNIAEWNARQDAKRRDEQIKILQERRARELYEKKAKEAVQQKPEVRSQRPEEAKIENVGLNLPKAEDNGSKLNGSGAPSQARIEIQSLVLPIIAEHLMAGQIPDVCAEKALYILNQRSMTAKDVLANFTYIDMIEVAKQQGLPKEVVPWIKGFYAYLENKARMELGGSAKTHVGPTA